jgi:multicomponent Na+:H+ antiporter subunit D
MQLPEFDINIIIVTLLAIPAICTLIAVIFCRLPLCMNLLIIIISACSPVCCFYLIQKFLTNGSPLISIKLLDLININIEPIGLIFISMASFLWVTTNLYSWSYLNKNPEINRTKFFFFLSISLFCTFAIAFSGNLITTFIFYELLTILTYPLVANVGTDHEKRSAKKYISILLLASMTLLLPAILILMQNIGQVDFATGGIISKVPNTTVILLFILFLYGVAKTAIVPLHSWLPAAMAAPIPVSALLHAVAVVKSGIFIMLKVIVYIFGVFNLQKFMTEMFNTNIITILCAASLIISSVIALHQKTIKKLLAYSTINQLSICLLSASMFHPLAIKASILHMVSHAIAKISLFFAAGQVYCSSRITKIDDFAGLGKQMKFTMVVFTIAALSIIGIPIFAGFISKAYVLFAALYNKVNYVVIVVLAFSIIITAHYFIKLICIIYYTKLNSSAEKILAHQKEEISSMSVAMFITCVGIVAYIFIYDHMINLIDKIQY